MSQPAATTLRDRKKVQTRKTIHKTALTLFEKKGYGETKIQEIAEASNVSESTFFRYFDSKEGVVLEGLRQRLELVVDQIKAQPMALHPIDACAKAVNDASKDMVDFILTSPIELKIIQEKPDLVIQLLVIVHVTGEILGSNFAERLDKNPNSLAVKLMTRSIVSSILVTFDIWRKDPQNNDLKQLAEEALSILKNGFGSVT